MDNLKTCSQRGCKLPAINDCDTCWEHLQDKDGFRKKLEQDVATGRKYASAVFVGADLSHLNLAGMIAPGANFDGADLYKVIFVAANLQNCSLKRCHINYTSFDRVNLRGSCLDNCIGKTPSFIGADLTATKAWRLVFTDANLSSADLGKSDWQGATIAFSDLSKVNARELHAPWSNLMGSILSHADFEFAVLGGSILDGAQASHSSFVRAILIGVSARATSFRDSRFHYARLTAGLFNMADFTNADLTRAVLRTASFHDARLDGADMDRAILDRARFSS